ncbi:uncharacterized protein LOC126681848 [Mercurialis annua]|uniref:uncharacterized protein LOC126681848 n=1 Tax=Mercurialis annua TaxID=3986 RepID=UPI00215E5FD0|nr:uncharacterized protein LOC126681848 [Mercurialis annua]
MNTGVTGADKTDAPPTIAVPTGVVLPTLMAAERIFTVLDMHDVASALTEAKPLRTAVKESETWLYANKEAKQIWESMISKYTVEDVGKQKFVIGNFYKWTMAEDKEVIAQINEYHKLLEDLKGESITLPEEFVAEILIEKLSQSWNDYKQNLKHKHKQLTLQELITHIIIEETNRKEIKAARNKALTAREKVVQIKGNFKRNWVVDSGATRHICASRDTFSSYKPVGDVEEHVFLGDSRTTPVLGKGKVLLKLTSGKTLALNEVLHVQNIRANLLSVALMGKGGVKVSFEFD